jgi:predicted DNA-binding helix-hairpin-helix protein
MAADAHTSVPAAPPTPRRGPAVVEHYVDLNSASSKELMTLPGIGAAEASRIIANRPYLTKTELVSKNVLPLGPFLSLKRFVVAMPATVPKGKS